MTIPRAIRRHDPLQATPAGDHLRLDQTLLNMGSLYNALILRGKDVTGCHGGKFSPPLKYRAITNPGADGPH